MKAPEVLLAPVASLSIEEGQPLCLPTPVVISNGSDVTAQGWKWTTDNGATLNAFNSCDKVTTAMNGAKIYYTAENGCSVNPAEIHYTTLTVTQSVGEFLQTASALCSGMTLDDCIRFDDGSNSGDYYIGMTKLSGNSWDDVKTTPLTVAHNLQVLRFSYNGGKSERRMTLTVHAVPKITTDPVTPATALCLGDAHTLTIEATGDNLAYQWERSVNSTDGTDGDWDNVPGSTTAACRLTADVSAYYRCTVTGVCIDHSTGVVGNKIASSPAELTVNDRPVIPDVTFTANDLKICAGVELSTILTAKTPALTGTAALDQGWTLGGVKVTAGQKALATDNGKVLGYWASNDCGERTATFSTGILAVTSRPELLQSPADVTTEENSSVRLSVLTGAGVKYEWYRVTNSADPYTGGDKIPAETSSSYVFPADELENADLIAGKKETEYYCKVIAATDVCKGNNADPTIDPADPAYVLSDVAKVTVSRRTTDITITSQPEAFPETCAGTAKAISITATGRGNLTCTWYSGSTVMADPANGTIVTNVNSIVPAPTNPLAADKELTSTFTPNAAGTYYCIIASTDNPGGVRSTQSVLTIHALPVLTDIAAGELAQTLCKYTDLSVKVSATGVGVTYEWQKSIDNGTTYSAFGENDSRLRTAITGDAMYRCVVKATCVDKATGYDDDAAGLVSSAVTVTMATKPAIAPAGGFTPAAFSKCEGESIALVDANVEVTENNKTVASGDKWWTLGGLQVANTYNVTRNDNGKTVGYSATNECGTTSVTFAAMKLSVDEKPQIIQDPADVSAVEDSRVRLSVSASGSNLTYKWQQKKPAEGDDKWADIDATANPTAKTAACSFTAANITTAVDLDGADVLTDYRCVVGTTNACSATTVNSAPATVTVTRSKAVVSIRRQPASCEVCNSAARPYAPGFTVEVEGSGRFVYKWYEVKDKVNPVAQTPASGDMADAVAAKSNTFQPSDAGTYYCVVTSTDDAAGAQTQTVVLTVSQAPVINGITPLNAAICEGGSVTLGVDATGSALTYQWYEQAGNNPEPATDARKGTSPTYTPVGLSSTVKFYCVVGSSSACTETRTSATVAVAVEKAPKITTQPLSQSVCGATGVSLRVVATNTDQYQWYHNGRAIADADGGTVAILTDVKEGGVYTCVVSKAGGVCAEATSVPALITVAAAPKVSLGSRNNLAACQGDLITLPSPEIETRGSVIVPDKTGWYLSTDGTAALVSSFVAGIKDVTYNYKLTYMCAEGGTETVLAGMMPTISVTVNTPVKITRQPVGYAGCTYNDLTVAATGSGLGYQWYKADGTAVTGAVSATYTPTADGSYHCLVGGACGSETSATAAVTKTAAVAATASATATALCPGETAQLTVNVTGGEAIACQWKAGGTAIAGAILPTLTVNAAGSYTCEVKGACNTVTTAAVTLTMKAATAITTLSGQPAGRVCNTAAMPTLQVAAAGNGALTYQWYKDGAVISGATGVSYTVKSTDLGAHNYEVKVSGGCGSMLSQAAEVEVVKAPAVTLATVPTVVVCPGESVTLPVVAVEANGSVLGAGGWLTSNTATSGFASAITAPAGNDATVLYYYRQQYTCGTEAAAYTTAVSVTVKTVAAPPVPAFTTGASATTVCEGDEVTLPVVTKGAGTRTDGYWMLNEQPKGDITKYMVHSADDKQVFKYVNVNRCGVKVTSTNTYTLNVKQPARITSVLSSPVIFQAGALLNTKITAPADNYGTIKKWTLNGSEIQLTKATTLTDDAGRLVYSVDNGCTTGIGTGGIDETSTTLQVWNTPVVGGTSSTTTAIYGKEGKLFGLPTVPVVTPNNCKIISTGWKYDALSTKEVAAHGTTAGLTALGAAVFTTHDKTYLYYEVAYQIPGDAATYYVRRAFGKLVPWKEPTIAAVTSSTMWDYVCDNKTFADMGKNAAAFTTVNCTNKFNCTTAVSWETENGRVVTPTDTASLAESGKKLYCVQTWTAPDGTATGKVKSQIATLKVTNVPTLTVTEGKAGTADIIYIGQDIRNYLRATATDHLNKNTLTYSITGGLAAEHHGRTCTIKTENLCGTVKYEKELDLHPKAGDYYWGVKRPQVLCRDGVVRVGNSTQNKRLLVTMVTDLLNNVLSYARILDGAEIRDMGYNLIWDAYYAESGSNIWIFPPYAYAWDTSQANLLLRCTNDGKFATNGTVGFRNLDARQVYVELK